MDKEKEEDFKEEFEEEEEVEEFELAEGEEEGS